MKIATALVIGYVIGARSGGRDLQQLTTALKALCETDEFSDVVAAARSQLGVTLRDVAAMVDGDRPLPDTGGDLVARVRHLVGNG